MENEIKVNEFVRYKDGDIIQIFQKIDREYVIKDNKDRIYTLPESAVYKDMVKHSSNLIDLIQCGDYVNGHLIEEIQILQDKKCLFYDLSLPMQVGLHFYMDYDIKEIVTKEMMESISYKVTKM